MSELKDINNYFPRRKETYDAQARKWITVTEILTSYRIFGGGVQIEFGGWEQDAKFNRGEPADAKYAVALGAESFPHQPALEAEIIKYFDPKKTTDWSVTHAFFDMQAKRITLEISHTTIANRIMREEIKTDADFDRLVANHQEMVFFVETDGWTHGQASSEFLEKFN